MSQTTQKPTVYAAPVYCHECSIADGDSPVYHEAGHRHFGRGSSGGHTDGRPVRPVRRVRWGLLVVVLAAVTASVVLKEVADTYLDVGDEAQGTGVRSQGQQDGVSDSMGRWAYRAAVSEVGAYEAYFVEGAARSSHVGVFTLEAWCGVEAPELDAVFISSPVPIVNDPTTVLAMYQFGSQAEDATVTEWQSNGDPESVVFAGEGFISDLAVTSSDTLYVDLVDRSGIVTVVFDITGLDAVREVLDCI